MPYCTMSEIFYKHLFVIFQKNGRVKGVENIGSCRLPKRESSRKLHSHAESALQASIARLVGRLICKIHLRLAGIKA